MASDDVRRPAVAGMFYEATRGALVRDIEACYAKAGLDRSVPLINDEGPRDIIGLVCPHAGYMYSGSAAAGAFMRLAEDGRPGTFVILGPNHGRGSFVNAIQTSGWWETPLGRSPIDEALATQIADAVPDLHEGPDGFVGEHSLEVQLPFIQHLYGVEAKIVPLMMLDQGERSARAVGEALGQVLAGQNAVIIASTDMTHFESAKVAERQDRVLIERMLALDPEGLMRERAQRGITMCGYGPVAAMMLAALELGATRAVEITYVNSGDVTGSYADVVAYLAMAFRKT